MDEHEDEKEKGRGGRQREGRTISGGLYLNYLGSIHTWDKHCHPKGLSRRHLTGTLYTAGVPRSRRSLWGWERGGREKPLL